MNRRNFLKGVASIPVVSILGSKILARDEQVVVIKGISKRVRPGDTDWPSTEKWEKLKQDVGGRLQLGESPLDVCKKNPDGSLCDDVVKDLRNPYYVGDQPGLTQSSGWVDGWISKPSAYVVEAANAQDVVAAVNFARENNLRIVVKGGGHSYQGTSNSSDSLLVWTRAMNKITLQDSFTGEGCEGKQSPVPAVTLGAGVMWMHAYDAVTTKAKRYVQGGGCATVGVAGLIQSGGFGSFSKNYGTAASGLLEAEIITADGEIRIANACKNSDLFWGIKGGGGGSLGVVTRLTLRTRDLPDYFGGAFGRIKASSDESFKKLISQIINFYRDNLLNPHWGEQIIFETENAVRISMVFQGLDKQQAEEIWKPFLEWIKQNPDEFTFTEPMMIEAIPAQHFWDPKFLKKNYPMFIGTDDRSGASSGNVFWKGQLDELGNFWHGFKSLWLSETLLEKDKVQYFNDALFSATRNWEVQFHFNKGLGGSSEDNITAAKDTAMNTAVLDAFALAIISGAGSPAYPGMPGKGPDLQAARQDAFEMGKAMDELLKLVPNAGSYVSESDFFNKSWQQEFWGPNYTRLSEVKKKYDPEGLFFVHHGVGSEDWSDDGFEKLK